MSVFKAEEERDVPEALPGSAARALILLPHDLPGGAERITMTVAEAALKSGRFAKVVIFVMSRGDHGGLAHLAVYPQARLIFAKTQRQRGGFLDLLRVLREGPYDFVFSSFLDINALVNLARQMGILKTRWLVTRESTMFFERDFGWKTRFVRALYRTYGAQNMIVCQTECMAHSLNQNTRRRFAHLVRTLPNPLPFSIADRKIALRPARPVVQEEDRIAWCGRITAVKSPLRAVETLACLHRMGRNTAKLVMIGDGQMKAETESFAQKLGLGTYVEFVGLVASPVDVMQTCRAGLMTSDVEGFPNVILEMLSSGIAGVASTNCAGGLDKIPGVLIASENTPQALAEALNQVLQREAPPQGVVEFLNGRHPCSFLEKLLANPA